MLVAEDPRQEDLAEPEPFAFKRAQLVPHARFAAEVRVLGRERYWLGTLAELSPIDLAVGWGPMSDTAVLTQLEISQSGRFYFWQYDDEPPVPPETIVTHSANWHLVPATDRLWRTLKSLRVGSIVRLEGQLVDIQTADAGTVKTSLRRDDSGAGACEILYVEAVSVRYH